jgi:ergothioneine biosynthesis protein EgtB
MTMDLRVGAPSLLDRSAVIAWYRRNRERSRALFDMLADEAYYSQPIALRHPIVFYEGHLPAFSFNTLVKKGLARPGIDPELERLFARGIDPAETSDAGARGRHASWPVRDEVRAFGAEADRQVLDAMAWGDVEQPGHPLLDRAEAVFSILEHEAMHQETLLYMWHRLPFDRKHRPPGYAPRVEGPVPAAEWIEVPAGRATLGVDRESIAFGWDNELPAYAVDVPGFEIDRHDVTNARFLEFVDAGGYDDPRWWRPEDWRWIEREQVKHPLFWERVDERWYWRGMFERLPLPLSWPVYVSQAEAAAFARWSGARLPSEAEFQRAASGSAVYGSSARVEPGDRDRAGVFDFSSWDPEPAGSHPAGASEWGVEDLIGNGWEWTSTPFAPFPGFRAMASYPEYSADFYDGEHVVMKGASPATARELLRPTFRNWFRPRYPYVYATFRCVTGPAGMRESTS